MRQISGGVEPNALTEWRQRTPGVGYKNMPAQLREIVKECLLAEQRGLCAYTGIRLDGSDSHIEHLIPQCDCENNEDVSYSNMVACYPSPGVHAEFGAVRKGNWPSVNERRLFVSPRSVDCESRFSFSIAGKIEARSATDEAARETIRRLALDDRGLEARRREAISGTLGPLGRQLDLRAARRRLTDLEQAETTQGPLGQFCFVLKQALKKHIQRLEVLKKSKKQDPD